MPNILAVVEQRDGTLRRVSNEVVTAARSVVEALGSGEVHALVIGGNPGAGASELGAHGADRVLVATGAGLDRFSAEVHASVAADVAHRDAYYAVLLPASAEGKDVAPRLAAKLDAPLATEATSLSVEAGEMVVRRPVFAGKAFATVVLKAEPRIVSLRPNVFTAEQRPGRGEVEHIEVGDAASASKVTLREFRAAEGESLDVAEAPVVVSGGRGMQGPEHWALLEALRDALGPAALGASRAVVDAGWRPHGEQVGQTGKTVAPQLYIAVGISGAIQHLAGMRTSKTIVAVNKDPDAPIFQVADYGIVGDAFEVVPRLTEEIRKLKQ